MHRLVQLLMRSLRTRSRSAEAGVTLLESLVAIVIIAIVTVAVTPPIFLVVATRVQNRRAEQAIQIAQGQIDRVRVTVDQGNYDEGDLPASIGSNNEVQTHDAANAVSDFLLSSTSGCTGAFNPEVDTVPANQLLKVDVDGDCTEEYLVQIFRNEGITAVDPPDPPTGDPLVPVTFDVGVRVYHNVARDNVGTTEFETTQASLKLTSGEGSQRRFPLAVSYTTLVKGETQFSLDRYRCLNASCP